MKGLSLWQPWATLIAIGAKQYETRAWSTAYRGPLLIHAGKYEGELSLFGEDPFHDVLRAAGFRYPHQFPRGVALCKVDLVDVIRTEEIRSEINDQERAFGNFAPGRFAWRLENIITFSPPITMRGQQGLWDVHEGIAWRFEP